MGDSIALLRELSTIMTKGEIAGGLQKMLRLNGGMKILLWQSGGSIMVLSVGISVSNIDTFAKLNRSLRLINQINAL